MIRLLFTLLLLHFSLTSLISCTTSETEDEAVALDGQAAPLDETETADAGVTESSGEDDLEAELEKDGSVANEAVEPAPPTEETAAVAPADDDLEKELSDQDMEEQPLAENEPPPQMEELQAAEPMPEPEPEPMPEPEPAPPPPVVEKVKIRDIRYMANANGGTVVIETSAAVTYQSRLNPATQQFVIEIADVELPPALQRPYNMKEFGSRFGSINAYQGEGSTTARVVIQLSGATHGEPIVQQEGTSLVVIPPAAPPVAARTPEPEPAKSVEKSAPQETALAARTLDEFLTGNQKFYGRAISLQSKDADVRDIINFLAEESGANIVMSDDVTGKISLKVRKIPWDQALVTVMRSKNLGYVRQANVLRISTLKALQAETEAANKIMEAQKTIAPSVVQVIPVSYASTDDLLKAVQTFLTKDVGKVVADSRSSTLIVTDKADVVDRIVKLVKTLDVTPGQVSIESKIVEAVEGFENFVGVNWTMTGSPVHLSPGGGYQGSPVDLRIGATSTTLNRDFTGALPFRGNISVGALDVFGDLGATLTLAEKDSLAKVISAPRISTMNREKSTIVQQGENVSVSTIKDSVTGTYTKTEKRTPYKLELSVTPQITSDGGIIIDLDVQREFLGPILDQEIGAREVNTRKAKTKVLVRNGQTAVIGGIYTSDELEASNGIPGLKHLPVIGWLFKNRSFSRVKNELLIFMTPRILATDNMNAEQASTL